MAVNISEQVPVAWSRLELLKWVNDLLKSDFKKIDELCTGAAYCQLMDILFEGCLPMKRVFYWTNNKNEYIKNFKLLANSFNMLKVSKHIPVEKLINGRYLDNFEFLLWFRHFFNANYQEHDYDPLASRNNMVLGFGPAGLQKNKSQARSSSDNSDYNNDDAEVEVDGEGGGDCGADVDLPEGDDEDEEDEEEEA